MYRQMKELSERYPEYVRISENRFSTIWGGASLLRMLVSCMYELLSMDDWKWDFVINLSESDYLLKNPEILTDFLSDNREKNFVKSHGRDSQVFVKKQGLDRTFHECDTHMFRYCFLNDLELNYYSLFFVLMDQKNLLRDSLPGYEWFKIYSMT